MNENNESAFVFLVSIAITASPEQPVTLLKSKEHEILSHLPQDHLTIPFTIFTQLRAATKSVHEKLLKSNHEGNQLTAIIGLSKYATDKLDHEKDIFGDVSVQVCVG